MRESGSTIFGSFILVTGYGRITKVLVKYLTALGAKVTVTARKYSDLAWAEIMGCETVHLSKLDNPLEKFDIIINTVPARIFDAKRLKHLKTDCLIIDLASKAGVEDLELARREGINVIWALSLPSDVNVDNFPKTKRQLLLTRPFYSILIRLHRLNRSVIVIFQFPEFDAAFVIDTAGQFAVVIK